MQRTLLIAALGIGTALGAGGNAIAQVAGSSESQVTLVEISELAYGWSATKSIIGKPVVNEAGTRIGKVEDLIIAPGKNVSYMIIGAGGFIGMGRHDVAVPASQVQQKNGKLVMAGATKESIKAMPAFHYATDTSRRDSFIASTEKDIAAGRLKLAEMERGASVIAADGKAAWDASYVALQADVKVVDTGLGNLKRAGASRWKEFEDDLKAASARLRKSTESARV